MPSSRPATIPAVLELVMEWNPQSILDVGSGFGKWGVLFREYLDGWQGSMRERKHRIDACEIHEDYTQATAQLYAHAYDKVYFSDVRRLATLGEYDLVFLGDVLEHLPKEDGQKVLAATKAYLVATPLKPSAQGEVAGNPSEAHVSVWTPEDFPDSKVIDGRYLLGWGRNGGQTTQSRLSVVLIVKNEEELLPGCLESLKGLGDELVIVDTGSTDRTVEIAKSYGARIGHFEWCDDFAAARNYAEGLCTGEYVYWQDADEVLLQGKELIREVVRAGKLDGLRPQLIMSRSNGRPASGFIRQEMLHRNNSKWKWVGAAHNYLEGPVSRAEPRIVVEHLQRPSGDRPNHKSMMAALRSNLSDGFSERHLFYLLRQHWYEKNYQEAVALAELLLTRPVVWPVQRSHAAVIAGNSYAALGQKDKARASYTKAIWEYGGWAEPYFALGEAYYKERSWAQGAAWLYASLPFDPPMGYFVDNTIYDWRRYDLLAVCLHKLGRSIEAEGFGQLALAVRPEDERLQRNQEYYRRGATAFHPASDYE